MEILKMTYKTYKHTEGASDSDWGSQKDVQTRVVPEQRSLQEREQNN